MPDHIALTCSSETDHLPHSDSGLLLFMASVTAAPLPKQEHLHAGAISPRALRGSVVSGNIGLQQPDVASPDSDLPPSSKTDDTALVALDDAVAKSPAAGTVDIHWQTVSARTRAIPTVHNPNSYAFQRVNPKTNATNPMHDTIYSRLKALGADHIRYMVRPNAQLRETGSGSKAKRLLGSQQAQDQNGLYNMWASPEPFAPDPRTKTTSWDM